ncbi:metallophosphoesterase [Arthrobacter sp. Sa2BUA2]|uniref:Phosphoesterase n=1 Tax=Arthrobacter pullicola TaxID=2762224 RepID=A0ABR8YF36_9MICC|nr:metallophosphoesterase [Arthrobacter pullicola]MBD8042829.1 metallophosphoesterase [Arthrobacter pullicola]
MTTRLVLLADTHLPLRAKALPQEVWDAVEAADLVVHAGDWVSEDLLNELQERSKSLLACWGNNDGPGLRARLPEIAHAVVGDVRLAVVHETGTAKGRETRMEQAFPETDLLIFGHSHIPWDSTAPGGLRLLNPGSPRDRRRQPFCTYMTAEISGRTVDVELKRLPLRSTPGARPGSSH